MKPNKELFQYDINQSLSGCTGKYIDFIINDDVFRVQVDNETCLIPDEMLQIAGDHTVYQTYEDGTMSEHRLFVYSRPKPPDYIYTPTEKLTFDGLVQKVDDAVADMIRRAESGEFDGHTPVKGTDYFTAFEIQQIQNEVSSGAIGEFKSVVDTETETFNINAETKLNAYNQNDSQKINVYNTNATEKLNAYNSNADNRVAEFDSNTQQIQTDISELKSDLNLQSETFKRLTLEDGKGTFLPYGNFINGTVNSGILYESIKYRVASKNIMSFDTDLEIKCNEAFSLVYHTFVGGVMDIDSGWIAPQNTPIIIPKGTEFKISICRYPTEDTSEIANIEEFVNALTFDTNINTVRRDLEQFKTDTEKLREETFKKVTISNKAKKTYNATTNIGITYTNGKVFTGGDYDTYCYTQKIPVSEGEIITLDTDYSPNCAIRYLCAYNGDSAVSDKGIQNVREYIVPNGIDGVVLSYNNEWANGIVNVINTNDIEKYVFDDNILAGKKWCACGDSFTYNGYATEDGFDKAVYVYQNGRFTGEYKTYPWMIGLRNDMNIVNIAMGGMTMAGIQDNSFTLGTSPVYKNIPLDSDYITLKFGINDSNHNVSIGTIDDTDINTFYGAWNTCLAYITENFLFAKVGIIVSSGLDNSNEYADATIEVAKKWGIPYLDEVYDYKVPLLHRVNRPNVSDIVKQKKLEEFRISETNTHPNVKAHEYESTFLENWLRTL